MEGILLFLGLFGATWLAVSFGGSDKADSPPDVVEPVQPGPWVPKVVVSADAPRQPTEPVLEGRAHITHGDSLIIERTQIRLFGVDAPEIDHPYGNKAKWALIGLCRGQIVRAVVDHHDHYGRTVAKCYLPDGRDLSAEMVKLGLAIDWPKFSGGCYRALEGPDVRRKLWLADARQQGRMHVWAAFEARQKAAGQSPGVRSEPA